MLLRMIAMRIGISIATLLAVSFVMFFSVSALPGDAATAVLGSQATPEQLATLRKEFGLNRPVATRYLEWLGGIVRGDLGVSLTAKEPVWELTKDRLGNSAALMGLTILVLAPLALIMGVLSAAWRDTPLDHAVMASTLTFLSTPEFVVGSLLVVLFSLILGWLPATSLIDVTQPLMAQTSIFVLPVLTLVLVAVAQATRMIRAMMIDVLHADYIQAALLRGVPRWRVVLRHALPNALDSTVQILALTVGFLIGGAVVTETLFQYPGVGTLLTDAVTTRDLTTAVSVSMIITAVYVVANLLADIAIIAINPRLRRRSRA